MHPFLFFDNPFFPPHVTYAWLIIILLAFLSFLATRRLDIYPNKVQNVMEVIVSGLENLLIDTMGPHGKKYFPLIATLGLYILTSNLLGLIPGFDSPTNNLNTTASMAVTVFLLTHIVGIRIHG